MILQILASLKSVQFLLNVDHYNQCEGGGAPSVVLNLLPSKSLRGHFVFKSNVDRFCNKCNMGRTKYNIEFASKVFEAKIDCRPNRRVAPTKRNVAS